ncbi:MAG: hypothetical protein ACM3VV_06550 [Deltaproteobacteria bacterium]
MEYRKLSIPAIIIVVIGGVISFFLAFNFYPEKHVNVNIDGKCYELIDQANIQYQNLVASTRLQVLKMQIDYIESADAQIPIIFSGYEDRINAFLQTNHLQIIEKQNITNSVNPSLNKNIVKAIISKNELSNLINNSEISDFYPYSNSIIGSIGIQPTQYFTIEEGKAVSNKSKELMYIGVKEIIKSKDGVKSAECRNI